MLSTTLKLIRSHLILLLILFSTCAYSATTEKQEMVMTNPSTLATILQIVLDHQKLQQYFHVNERPERKPLVIVKNDLLASEPALEKFSTPVVFKNKTEIDEDSDAYLEFIKITLDEKSANVSFLYHIEGIKVDSLLSRDYHGWEIVAFSIVEQ